MKPARALASRPPRTSTMDKTTSSSGLADLTDAELVQQALQGNNAAFQELTTRYYHRISGYVYKRVQKADVVEDLAQETFLEAFRTLKTGRPPEHFGAWLFAIAHNCCGKWLRRKRPHLFDPNEAPDLTATPSEAELREEMEEQQVQLRALEGRLAELPDEIRRLLEMKHVRGLTCEQIATATHRPVGTVKSLLSRTYKELRARLGLCGEQRP
jgi:RNA polymerase sigma-70 factor (ECF subfamily)